MVVKTERDDNIRIITLEGSLDANSSDQALETILGSLDGKPTIISLEKCKYISSMGIRSLLTLAKKAKAQSIKLAFAAATEEVYEVLDMTGFNRLLMCVGTIEEAEKNFLIRSRSESGCA